MDGSFRKQVKTAMKKEIAELKARVDSMQDSAGTVALDQPIGRLTRMDSMINQGIAMNSVTKAKTRIARLEQALKRIDDPDFGICLECDEPIAPARLLAIPECVLCVHCAE